MPPELRLITMKHIRRMIARVTKMIAHPTIINAITVVPASPSILSVNELSPLELDDEDSVTDSSSPSCKLYIESSSH